VIFEISSGGLDFDRNGPVEEFLPKLDDKQLEMHFPEATLNSRAEFKPGMQAS
jgi:hypothetical protein